MIYESFPEAYLATCRAVTEFGQKVSPRGLPTLELRNYAFTVRDPRKLLPVNINRKLFRKFAYEEALQLCGGFTSTARLVALSKHVEQFTDFDVFHGAYGPRVIAQLSAATEALKMDPHTRRSIIQIWDPLRDNNTPGMANYPCTTQLQFMIRQDKLEAFTIMRANDVWAGLAYDVFCFGQLQHSIANALSIEAGMYHHYATSMHAYERDFDKLASLTDYAGEYGMLDPTGFGRPTEDVMSTAKRIQQYAMGKDSLRTPSEKSYDNVLSR